ncbi:Fic family protein [soil metagenome]
MLPIEIPVPRFDSATVRAAFEIERIRAELRSGTTPANVFFELHGLFAVLTSIVSARIEGNRTSVRDAIVEIEEHERDDSGVSDSVSEIINIRSAMRFIDEAAADQPLTHSLIRELHRRAVTGLSREGDRTPGSYRTGDVSIAGARHVPPQHFDVMPTMDELLTFINLPREAHMQLLHVAVAHHRFLWIHPFGNGNGRVSRLMSYWMLRRDGFVSPNSFRTINPTAVFGGERSQYYDRLSGADDLSEGGIEAWCEYFLSGMLRDLQRVRTLQDFDFVADRLVSPALDRMVNVGRIQRLEADVLLRALKMETIRAGDVSDIVQGSASQRSVALRALIERGFLAPVAEGRRQYRLSFAANEMTGFLVSQLDSLDLLPSILRDN